ncbi:MAG: SDR family oxidoreductase [Clostridiales bacterium]|nr:SDR family oxidoreductase [Clostridiales bacterium]
MNMIRDPFDLTGKTMVMIGAGGMGRVMSLAMAYRGADIFSADIDEASAEETAELCSKVGVKAFSKKVDISSPEDIESAFQFVMNKFNKVDILVNAVGITVHKPAQDLTLDEWDKVMNVNIRGTFLSCRAFGGQMLKQKKGSIINFSSIAGLAGLGRGNTVYSASKGAVVSYSRELAIEWAPSNVRVNVIVPCQFSGYKWDEFIRREYGDYDAMTAKFASNIPIGRIGTPEEMVAPVIFLACDAASMVTGIVLPVDGGYLAK